MKMSAIKSLSMRDFMGKTRRRKHLAWTTGTFLGIVPQNPRETAMPFKDILYAVDGAVATITLNRPNYRNALGYRMLDEIDVAFSRASADKSVRVVVVRGAGGN